MADKTDRRIKSLCDGQAQVFEHSPLMCGLSEETDCPVCLIKYWPLRRQGDIEARLAAAGIDYQDLADLLVRPLTPKLEKIIAICIDDTLRYQQLSLLSAWRQEPEREALREYLRELLFDDIVEIAEAVQTKRKRRGKQLQRKD